MTQFLNQQLNQILWVMSPRCPCILKLPRYVYSTVKDDSYSSKIFQEEIETMVGIKQVLGLIFFFFFT